MLYYRIYVTAPTTPSASLILDTSTAGVGRVILDPQLKVEIGKAGSLEFTILPDHELYSSFTRLTTYVTVEEHDDDISHHEELFRGRVVELETDLYGQKKVSCEGDLAYLGDSVFPPLSNPKEGIAVGAYFSNIISNHNTQMGQDEKKFTVGQCDYWGVTDTFTESNYQNSSRALEGAIDYHGGYLRTRKNSSGATYIDYVLSTVTKSRSVPRITFAENLLDFTEKVSAEDLFTVLIPLGDKSSEAASDGTEVTSATSFPLTLPGTGEITVDEVIKEANAISTFGRIVKTESFSGVKDAATLRLKAEEYIRNNYDALPEEFTVKAIDLRYLDGSYQPFAVGENIQLIVPIRNVNKTLCCTAIQYDLYNPDNTEIEIGQPKQTKKSRNLTDRQAQSDAKSKGAASRARSAVSDVEYLTWKDIQDATELNSHLQKITLIGNEMGGTIVTTDGKLTFQWSDKGLNSKVTAAQNTADTANTKAGAAKTAAETNAEDIANQGVVLWGNNKTYGDWKKSFESATKSTLLDVLGDLYADNGLFKTISVQELADAYWLVANHLRSEDMSANNMTLNTALTVSGSAVSSSNPNGEGLFYVGGGTDKKNNVAGVNANGLYAKDIQIKDTNNKWYQAVSVQYYPILSLNGSTLRVGAASAGEDGYTTSPQSVDLSGLIPDVSGFVTANTDVSFGKVTATSIVFSGGTNSSGQPNPDITFARHQITMGEVVSNTKGTTPPWFLSSNDLNLSHTHEFTAASEEDSSGKETGKIKIVLKDAIAVPAGQNENAQTFDIASTKFYKDAIVEAAQNASVNSIEYYGSAGGMSVGSKQYPGTSTTVPVLNNVPLKLTLYGKDDDGKAIEQTNWKVSGIELPDVSLQNGSGETPVITYDNQGRPTIAVKAVMGNVTVKSTETYVGDKVYLHSSYSAPTASSSSGTYTAKAYNGAEIKDSALITSKSFTLEHEIGKQTISDKPYLRVRTSELIESSETPSNIFYTDYPITWNTSTITNSDGQSSVTAIVYINGVKYDSHTFTGTYATAESDNDAVRAAGWTAAYRKVVVPSTQSNLKYFTVKTPKETENSTPDSTTYSLEQNDDWDSDNTKYVYIQNGTTEKNVARLQVDASGIVRAAENAIMIGDPTVTYSSTETSFTLRTSASTPSTKSFDWYTKLGSNPTAGTDVTGSIAIYANGGTAQNPSMKVAEDTVSVSLSGTDISFTEANVNKPIEVTAKVGSTVIAKKTVNAKYTGNSSQYDSMNVTSTAFSNVQISKDTTQGTSTELYKITADQTITLGDGGEDTTHGFSTPWYTKLSVTPSQTTPGSANATLAITAKAGTSSDPSMTVASSNYVLENPLSITGAGQTITIGSRVNIGGNAFYSQTERRYLWLESGYSGDAISDVAKATAMVTSQSGGNGDKLVTYDRTFRLTQDANFNNNSHQKKVYLKAGSSTSDAIAEIAVDASNVYGDGWSDCYKEIDVSPTTGYTLDYGKSVTVNVTAKANATDTTTTTVKQLTFAAPDAITVDSIDITGAKEVNADHETVYRITATAKDASGNNMSDSTTLDKLITVTSDGNITSPSAGSTVTVQLGAEEIARRTVYATYEAASASTVVVKWMNDEGTDYTNVVPASGETYKIISVKQPIFRVYRNGVVTHTFGVVIAASSSGGDSGGGNTGGGDSGGGTTMPTYVSKTKTYSIGSVDTGVRTYANTSQISGDIFDNMTSIVVSIDASNSTTDLLNMEFCLASSTAGNWSRYPLGTIKRKANGIADVTYTSWPQAYGNRLFVVGRSGSSVSINWTATIVVTYTTQA